MVKIKICGITKIAEVEFINELEPDYVGFVFSKSKRKVNIYEAYRLIRILNKSIKTVGVFVNEEIEYVNLAVQKLKLDIVQLHGDENQNYIDCVKGASVWKALGVKDNKIRTVIENYKVDGILLDSVVKGIQGGSGVSFNWELASEITNNHKIILAGGLDFNNISRAIRIVRPFAVDVSSGVEGENGKSYERCKKFIQEVRKICKEDLDNLAGNMYLKR